MPNHKPEDEDMDMNLLKQLGGVVVILAGVFAMNESMRDDIEKLDEDIEKLDEELKEVNGSIENVNRRIGDVEGDVEKMQANIGENQRATTSALANLQTAVQTAVQIGSLRSSVTPFSFPPILPWVDPSHPAFAAANPLKPKNSEDALGGNTREDADG